MGSHAAERHERLGRKWVCFSCQAKFYDLNRADPACPKCGVDPRQAPVAEPARRGRKAKSNPSDSEPVKAKVVTLSAERMDDDADGSAEDFDDSIDDDDLEELDLDEMDLSAREDDELEDEVA
jgi:uncharacterized protein (TIGR02300 family)